MFRLSAVRAPVDIGSMLKQHSYRLSTVVFFAACCAIERRVQFVLGRTLGHSTNGVDAGVRLYQKRDALQSEGISGTTARGNMDWHHAIEEDLPRGQ